MERYLTKWMCFLLETWKVVIEQGFTEQELTDVKNIFSTLYQECLEGFETDRTPDCSGPHIEARKLMGMLKQVKDIGRLIDVLTDASLYSDGLPRLVVLYRGASFIKTTMEPTDNGHKLLYKKELIHCLPCLGLPQQMKHTIQTYKYSRPEFKSQINPASYRAA